MSGNNKGKQEIPRKFTKEYKDEAVKLVIEGGLTKQQVAEDLGVGLSTIDKWVQERKGGA
ncbi:MAG: transposase [Deltaproteobacteria bacterium]|nr:transposase [Deltaproteobacteria bacterium]